MADRRFALLIIPIVFLILLFAVAEQASIPVGGGTSSSGEVVTACPSNQYAFNESLSGNLSCSQVANKQLSNPIWSNVSAADQSQTGTSLVTSTYLQFANAKPTTDYVMEFDLAVVIGAIGSGTGISLSLLDNTGAGEFNLICVTYVTAISLTDETNICTNSKSPTVATVITGVTTNQVSIHGFASITSGSSGGQVGLRFSSNVATSGVATLKQGSFWIVSQSQ